MFSFGKKKMLSEQLATHLLKDNCNAEWIAQDLDDMGFSSASSSKTRLEMVILNTYCSYLAISFFFTEDESRANRITDLLLNKTSFILSESFEIPSKFLQARLNQYQEILNNVESNDEYYKRITKEILENCHESFSETKAAALAGKIYGKMESDKKILSKVSFID